jgi:mannose-6-phosphate isomerase-like protein (cupin superfamily)
VKDSWDLVVKSNAAITLRASSNTTKLPWKNHVEADELWFVYRGSAKVSLAPFSLMVGVTPPGETFDVSEGAVVNVPRHLAYQIVPAGGRFEYVAVRRFAIQTPNPGTAGRGGGPPVQLPTVTTKTQLDEFFSTATASAAMGGNINRIVYNGKPGPAENHELDEHVYFVMHGTARATLDGYVTNPYWDVRGLMGSGVVGGTEYTIDPGDMVFVFRNTVHYIEPQPASSRVGYLLVDLPESEAFCRSRSFRTAQARIRPAFKGTGFISFSHFAGTVSATFVISLGVAALSPSPSSKCLLHEQLLTLKWRQLFLMRLQPLQIFLPDGLIPFDAVVILSLQYVFFRELISHAGQF